MASGGKRIGSGNKLGSIRGHYNIRHGIPRTNSPAAICQIEDDLILLAEQNRLPWRIKYPADEITFIINGQNVPMSGLLKI